MITVHHAGPDGKLSAGGLELLEGPGNTWVDVQAPTAAEMKSLAERFELHALEVEDALTHNERPKLELFPGHTFIVLQGFRLKNVQAMTLDVVEMHLFVGPHWVMTVHSHESPAVAEALKRVRAEPARTLGRGADRVAYAVADAMVDAHFPIFDSFNDHLEELETAVFEQVHPEQLQRLFQLKRQLSVMRRVLSPQRDVMGMLSREGVENIHSRTTLYFRDVYDHLIRLYEQIDADRDLLGNIIEGYLSMMANRTANVSKQLTVIATVFLPLSFVVGFFGQNFSQLQTPFFFWVMLASMVVIPATLFIWFRRQHWV